MTPQTVVVTGAGGYLGRELVRQLAVMGKNVLALTRSSVVPVHPRVLAVRTDIRDDAALFEAFRGADAVFHLAAYAHDLRSVDDSADQQAITLGGTVSALSAAQRAQTGHFIYASSLAVHGPVGSLGVDETHECRPVTPYGRAKLSAEVAVREFSLRTGAFAACIRPAMIYGVGCPGNLPRMIRGVKRGTFPPIPEFGNFRSMIWVGDVAAAMIRAWQSNVAGGRPYILTDGQAYSTRRIYDEIRSAIGKTPVKISIPLGVFAGLALAGDLGGAVLRRRMPFDSAALDRVAGSAYFKSDRARLELGFHPTKALSDVLPAMVLTSQ